MSFKVVFLFFKGLIIGLSTVLPGISGGTMAFVLGVYHKLINEISQFSVRDFKFCVPFLDRNKRLKSFKDFIKKHDWSFLFSLGLGIVCSVILFALWAPQWIDGHDFEFRAIIFGLVLSSLYSPLKSMKKDVICFTFLFGAFVFSLYVFYFIDSLGSLSLILGEKSSLLYIISGFICSLALVIPGISGAYILILFGLYSPLLKALVGQDMFVLSFFTVGLILGFFSMVHLMKFLLKAFFDETQSVLIGFILGSLFYLLPFFKDEILFNERSLEFLVYSAFSFLFVSLLSFFYRRLTPRLLH